MDLNYYRSLYPEMDDLSRQASRNRSRFFQYVLIASSSMLGAIVALYHIQSSNLNIRLVFSFGVVLLLLGILMTAIVLYDHSRTLTRLLESYLDEFRKALIEDRKLNPVQVEPKKKTLFFEKCSLCLLAVSLLLLAVYVILLNFYS